MILLGSHLQPGYSSFSASIIHLSLPIAYLHALGLYFHLLAPRYNDVKRLFFWNHCNHHHPIHKRAPTTPTMAGDESSKFAAVW